MSEQRATPSNPNEPSIVQTPRRGGDAARQAMAAGDGLRKEGRAAEAIEQYRLAARATELPGPDACLRLARCHRELSQLDEAIAWLLKVTDTATQFTQWQSAAQLLRTILAQHAPPAKRTAKAAVLGSYTTTQLVPMLQLAALRQGVLIETYESDYDQYQQDVLDPSSGLYAFGPDFILFAVHEGAAVLPAHADDAQRAVDEEVRRWTNLWETASQRSEARIIQHNFAVPPVAPMGHLSVRLPGSRYALLHRLNHELGVAAGSAVSIVDCERLAATFGKLRWFDDRYWYMAKQAVALDALPMLAQHTTAVLAADLGLSRKCLVLDLDNTLWGGVIGEDGLTGITLGDGPAGEAYVALQKYTKALKDKGVILAVASKNNDADAREPFEQHPDMVLSLDDISMFVANWQPKHENIRQIAETLNIGLDALVFLDDNPAEREIVRRFLPEVEVLVLPEDPTGYPRALANYLMFETSSFTEEDAKRAAQYKARAEIAELEGRSGSIEDFYRSLQMKAVVAPFDELHLPRIVQLIGKTNQFNLTTRRHNIEQVRRFMNDPDCAHLYLKLEDRFTDHGLVGLIIALRKGDTLEIDTWLMSCRVIGRTVEAELLSHLCAAAQRMNCTKLRGTYIPTAKNAMVKDVFERFEFAQVSTDDGTTVWEYDIAANGPIENGFIEVVNAAGKTVAEEVRA